MKVVFLDIVFLNENSYFLEIVFFRENSCHHKSKPNKKKTKQINIIKNLKQTYTITKFHNH